MGKLKMENFSRRKFSSCEGKFDEKENVFHQDRLATCEFFFLRYRLSTNFFSRAFQKGRENICSRNLQKILAGKTFFGKYSQIFRQHRRWKEFYPLKNFILRHMILSTGRWKRHASWSVLGKIVDGKFIEEIFGSLSLRNWIFQEKIFVFEGKIFRVN